MDFIQLKITCDPDTAEILIAELAQLNFDSFEEIDGGIVAAIEESLWKSSSADKLLEKYEVNYSLSKVPQINWNKEWERSFQPISIGNDIFIGASFHKFPAGYKHYLQINPKMSFGTGHHATTALVMETQLTIDHQGKSVLDVGCGTGILSILAHLLGADKVTAIDIDDWCIENSKENFALNQCENIELFRSEISGVAKEDQYDIILANINRNVLVNQMKDYSRRMKPEGFLLMSGFYAEDMDLLMAEAKSNGLHYCFDKSKDKWAVLQLKKS